MKLNPESIARASSRHPVRTLVIWVLVFLAAGASSSMLLDDALTTDFDFTNNPEAKQAITALEEAKLTRDVATESFVITAPEGSSIEDPVFVAHVNDVLGQVAALGEDVVTASPPAFPLPEEVAANPEAAALGPIPAEDGSAVLFTVVLTSSIDDAAEVVPQLETIAEETTVDGAETFFIGQASSTEDFRKISEEDLRIGEGLGILAAIIVLLIVFSAIIGGMLPIIMGVFAIAVTLGIMGVLGQLWSFSFFAPNLVSMMGLAVGIDYALFIVSRNREERHAGKDKLEAIGRAGATANRAVFFSGLTVVLALAGMLLVPTTIFRSLAGGAILVVLVSVAASMTLLPALLALFGDWVNWPWLRRGWTIVSFVVLTAAAGIVFTGLDAVGAPPALSMIGAAAAIAGVGILLTRFVRGSSAESRRGTQREGDQIDTKGSTLSTDGGFWDRMTNRVMARPVTYLVVAGGFMVLLSLPYWFQQHPDGEGRGIKTGLAGISSLPDETQTKQAFDLIVSRFPGAGLESSSVDLVIQGEVDAAALQALTADLADDTRFGQPLPPQPNEDGSVTLVRIPLAGEASDGQNEAAVAAVVAMRDTYVPAAFGEQARDLEGTSAVLVGGQTAFVTDFFDISDTYTPMIILLVLALSFVLLTIVFRSIVVPVKAIIMNLLSVGAAYGLIVLVFQQGGPAFGESIANLFGFQQVEAIESWLPLFLFSILFGLSMDYHVFLLTRIRERYDQTRDNAGAVAFGLRTTGGIITGAAIIMVAVFAGFAAGRLTSLEQMGFGLAVAVLLDATVVRSILVPSTMRLLGDRNWYLPGWLQWLPNIDVEGHAETVAVPDTPAELVEAGERADG
jgi:RND superfamily putative drug exporter